MSFSFLFVHFPYSGVYSDVLGLSLCDVIVFQKTSTGDGKFTLCGWNYYFHRSLSTDLHSTVRKTNKKKAKRHSGDYSYHLRLKVVSAAY